MPQGTEKISKTYIIIIVITTVVDQLLDFLSDYLEKNLPANIIDVIVFVVLVSTARILLGIIQVVEENSRG